MDECMKDGNCECCWEFAQINVPAIWQSGYEMFICDDCLENTEANS